MGAAPERSGWRFADPRSVAVFTTADVLERGLPICLVSHDDDGDWQFHTAAGTDDEVSNARLVALGEIAELDPTLIDLADLPRGWQARRRHVGSPWRRARSN